jgi:EAL domain-containing protein (putative c-di-GMP-specific phosphodiesterase class I)
VFALSMLRQAAEHLVAERKKQKTSAPLFAAMNVSWSQMKEPAFAKAVGEIFSQFALPKGSLVLELTEGEAIGNEAEATPVFRKLKDLGAALAFDDFGAGFSCLSNVRKYDFDYIKIDKSFAQDLDAGGDGGKIVAALADMGAKLGLKVILEGVETASAAKTAASLGCAYAQGYALGRPDVSAARKTPTSAQKEAAPSAKKSDATANEPNNKPDDALTLAVDLKAEETTPANDEKPEAQSPKNQTQWLWRRSRGR